MRKWIGTCKSSFVCYYVYVISFHFLLYLHLFTCYSFSFLKINFSKETLSSIIGSNAQSTATIFRKTLPNETCFCLSELEWEQIAPTKAKSGRKRFSEGWTDIFVRHMNKTNPFCSFNCVKSVGSRKRWSRYFHAKASCCHPGCPVNATIIIKPEDETSRKVTVQYSDAVFHDTTYIAARQLRGNRRKALGNYLANEILLQPTLQSFAKSSRNIILLSTKIKILSWACLIKSINRINKLALVTILKSRKLKGTYNDFALAHFKCSFGRRLVFYFITIVQRNQKYFSMQLDLRFESLVWTAGKKFCIILSFFNTRLQDNLPSPSRKR